MKKIAVALAACLSLLAGAALAHGPSRLKARQVVALNATVEDIWPVIGSFEDAGWLPGTVSAKAGGNEKGATRVMESGEVVKAELLRLAPTKYAIPIRLTEDNLDYVRATNYALHITPRDEGGKAVVDLKGAFYRALPLNDPPANLNDDAPTAVVEALHQGMIDALVVRFGAGG